MEERYLLMYDRNDETIEEAVRYLKGYPGWKTDDDFIECYILMEKHRIVLLVE